ncbi:LysE family translocator [Winogradskyella undariae]|uniref:LysE family translocator n=1 Tax=Winogradskyella TaxID=286104 RepID=UPI00156BB170|nr:MULTISPECIES: LysE family translocator [Winogradskyella]NRR90706.1 LysE family translocator [Winogradskyella undariae]QXP79518.1 LysE family translocator [Winogradskyella sp. HaHa_3_26]
MNYDILISFALATSILAISPGPDNIFVLIQSITNGKSYGLATVCGLMSGCLVHTTLLAFGVSAVIKANDHLFFGIKLLGAFYLLYLAYKVFMSDAELNLESNVSSKRSLKGLFVKGFFMNVLNPKVAIFFLAFFPGFLFSKTMNTVVQFYVLGGVFVLVSFIVFSSVALLAGQIKTYTVKHKNSGLVLKWLQIIVFVGIAIFILL